MPPRSRPFGGGLDVPQDRGLLDNVTRTPRRPPPSPIYEAGGPFASMFKQVQPPKLARDKLYDRMCDWEFHTVAELESWMPEREWWGALYVLNDWGFAFDREGTRIRLRKKRPGERKQSIVELMSGITVPSRFEDEGEKVAKGEVSSFVPESDQEEKPPEEEQMFIDEDRSLVLSAQSRDRDGGDPGPQGDG